MEIEELLFRKFNSLAGRFEPLDGAMIFFSSSNTWIAVGLLVFSLCVIKKNSELLSTFFSAILSLACADIVSFRLVKQVIARERPCRFLEDVKLILDHCGGSFGFTSNHAANAFAVCTVVVLRFGWRHPFSGLSFALAFLVAISRVYLGVHFWGDILGGAVVGTLVALTATRLGLGALSDELSRRLVSYFPSSGK